MHCWVFLFCSFLLISAWAEEPSEELLLSTPDQFATLISEPDQLVGGLISPLSGQLALKERDLLVKGAQNIALIRVYIPPHMPASFPKHKQCAEEYQKKYLYRHLREGYVGWQFLPHRALQFNSKTGELRLSFPSGATLDFRIVGSKTVLASPAYAMNNVSGEMPSGKYDLRNTRISFPEKNTIAVFSPDGSTRFYQKKEQLLVSTHLYYLLKELLPNGKILRYTYNEVFEPILIESLDPEERYVYASLRIARSLDRSCYRFFSSHGSTAEYQYERRSLDVKIKETVPGSVHKEEFHYVCPPILTSVKSPFYENETLKYCSHFLLGSYSGENHLFKVGHNRFGEIPYHKVDKLSLPVGPDNGFETVYKLDYEPPIAGKKEGKTEVKKSDGTSITYHFSKNFLATAIQYFDSEGQLQREKILSWTKENWLQSLEMRDGQKNGLYKRSYKYDSFGNPIHEVFTGDLTGQGARESYTIWREFSQDGRNLLLKEKHEDGKQFHFYYLPGTNLITAKFTTNSSNIFLREFFTYDDCCNLVQVISDDGSKGKVDDLTGVTQRSITKYLLRQDAPFLHMPEWIEESCLEEGFLRKRHLIYDAQGNIAEEEIYGADGEFAYTLYREYNERGDLLSETNPLGKKAHYEYDKRGNCTATSHFSGRLQHKMRYDAAGRLRERKEIGEGVTHETLFAYDFQDRLIQKRDSFGNKTHYTYDPLVDQVMKTTLPSGDCTVSTYDSFGREVTRTDENGNTVVFRHNAYGSPVEVDYPDGGKELFSYEKNGSLASYTDQDGLTTHYTRDILGRIVTKTYFSPKEEKLAEETFAYSGFNLLRETDREGNKTKYTYDGSGRKIREERSGRRTEFSYDALGRLAGTCEGSLLFTEYKRDLEGRLLKETKQDVCQICYTYDDQGNKNSITRNVGVETFLYDSFNRLIEHRDPLSYKTTYVYDENQTDVAGRKVLQIRKTDPRGIQTVETKDVAGRSLKEEVFDAEGMILSRREKEYDPHGNLSFQKDFVYENGRHKSAQTTCYAYTSTHQTKSVTRAFGTKEAQTTRFTYFPSGKVKTKQLPSGITLAYEYHPLGFLKSLRSSDGQIEQSFAYNLLGHLTYAADGQNSICRKVDPFGNLLQEIFPSGLQIDKEYDKLGRLISIDMGKSGKVLYTYDPLFLREVTRLSSKGDELYSHRYEEYDLSGNLVSEKMIGNLGDVVHLTDLKGQKSALSSPYFSQICSYDPVGNLIAESVSKQSYSYDGLSQLSTENGPSGSSTYSCDSLYNRTDKERNDLNQLLSFSYDLNGNQTTLREFFLSYDPLNRLKEATSERKKISFAYDALGRRIAKSVFLSTPSGWKEEDVESYLYSDQNEIGAFGKNIKVLGIAQHKNNPKVIAVELQGKAFAPILDIQGNIRKLIDLESATATEQYEFTAFGKRCAGTKTHSNPWCFASKRLDPELGTIYFGKRDYDPELGRWLSMDPAGSIDSINLYQYVLNNPFRYTDPDGRNAVQINAGLPLLAWGAGIVCPILAPYLLPFCIYTLLAGSVAYGGYKAIEAMNNSRDIRIETLAENWWGAGSSSVNHKGIDVEVEERAVEQKYKKQDKNNEHRIGDAPLSNTDQIKQADDAKKEIERQLGRKLSEKEIDDFHDLVTKQGYDYHQMVEEGYWCFYGK